MRAFPHTANKHAAHIGKAAATFSSLSTSLYGRKNKHRFALTFQNLAVSVCVWFSPERAQIATLVHSVWCLNHGCDARGFHLVQWYDLFGLLLTYATCEMLERTGTLKPCWKIHELMGEHKAQLLVESKRQRQAGLDGHCSLCKQLFSTQPATLQ